VIYIPFSTLLSERRFKQYRRQFRIIYMPRGNVSEPMPVKHWSFAGLLLTYRCNARCESCYLCCSPDRTEAMSAESAIAIWEGLICVSPHGCRVHLSGGEPFLDWPRLIEICRAARRAGLSPLEKVETNAFWADSPRTVRERVRQLDEAGMGKLSISADPYHQQYVALSRARLAADVAREELGPSRVQVRWEDWLRGGADTGALPADERKGLFLRYAVQGRDRLGGRAAEELAPLLELKSLAELPDKPCREALLRSRHVHVDPEGRLMPGTCAGIVLGRCGEKSIAEIWRELDESHASRPVVGRLALGGPKALLGEALSAGMKPRDAYASRCHLCWDVRRYLASRGMYPEEIGPAWMYGEEAG
jgi:MoaA/NifB/PqqE/SkfB family radical SAM enzyme